LGADVTTINDVPEYVGPFWLTRRLVLAGLIAAFVLAAVLAMSPYEASKECKGGAFSTAFGSAFEAQSCDVVFKFGSAGREVRIPLPDILQLCCPREKRVGDLLGTPLSRPRDSKPFGDLTG
jgi:hypothetical protein